MPAVSAVPPPPDPPPVPEPPVPAVSAAFTVRPARRLVDGFGARKRSQWAPPVVDFGRVTVPENVPAAFTAAVHCPMISLSSSLTVTFWPLANPERVKETLPPAVTSELPSRTPGCGTGDVAVAVGFGVGFDVGVGVGVGVGDGASPVTVRFSLLTLVCGARNRSQCSPPTAASAGTVTAPVTLPSSPTGNCFRSVLSSNLTLSVAPAGKPDAVNGTSPPGFTAVAPRTTVGAVVSATRASGLPVGAPSLFAVASGTVRAPRPSVAPAASAAMRPTLDREVRGATAGMGVREGLSGFMVGCSWQAESMRGGAGERCAGQRRRTKPALGFKLGEPNLRK